jgi:hypothetical protein
MDEMAMSHMTASHIEAARWKKNYDFTCACGRAHNPRDFVVEILSHIGELCAFDQALAYFIDGN